MDFIFHAMKMVLGRELLENENRHHVNTNIASHFLASLLNVGGERFDILMLLRKNFKEEYMDNDIEVISHVIIKGEAPLGK